MILTRPLRIGCLVPGFPGRTHGAFRREFAALEALGVEVCLLSTRTPSSMPPVQHCSEPAMARATCLDGRDIAGTLRAALHLMPRGLDLRELAAGAIRDMTLSLAAARRLVALSRAEGFDHVHVHSAAAPALIPAFASCMGGPFHSLTLHAPLSRCGPGQRLKRRGAAFATAVTPLLAAEARGTFGAALPARVLVQPMGVDSAVFRRDMPYVPVSHGRPMPLLSCARLACTERHGDAMSAVRQLLDMGVDVRLEIAGAEGGDRVNLGDQLKRLRLRDHMTFLGVLHERAVRERLLAADAFVLAAWHDPPGVAVMEAMSCGHPVTDSDPGGSGTLIRNGRTGVLVPTRNPGALTRAIRDLAGDPEYALGLSTAGRAHVVRNFQSRNGAETLVAKIRRATADPVPAPGPAAETGRERRV